MEAVSPLKGGDAMSDYELLMIVLTMLILVVSVKNK